MAVSGLTLDYYYYSAILVVKLLALIPLGNMTCTREKMHRASLNDLRHLTPFWLISGIYVTTCPNYKVALNLMRAFVAARLVKTLSYVTPCVPYYYRHTADVLSVAIPAIMALTVIYNFSL